MGSRKSTKIYSLSDFTGFLMKNSMHSYAWFVTCKMTASVLGLRMLCQEPLVGSNIAL